MSLYSMSKGETMTGTGLARTIYKVIEQYFIIRRETKHDFALNKKSITV